MFEKYDREELYRKVWEQPMLKVAEEYGVSAVALGKTCRKLSVPACRGHWAKLAHGHAGSKKPPLPKLEKIPVIYRSPVEPKRPAISNQNDPELQRHQPIALVWCAEPAGARVSARPPALIRHTASLPRSRSRND